MRYKYADEAQKAVERLDGILPFPLYLHFYLVEHIGLFKVSVCFSFQGGLLMVAK